jgi:MFS family permease
MLGIAFSALGNGLTLPFLVVYLHQVRGLPTATAGLVLAWMGVVSAVCSPVAGALVDRRGPRVVLLTGLVVQATGVALLAWVTGPGSAFGAVTLVAAGLAAVLPAQLALLAQLAPPGQRERVFGVQFMLLNLGVGLGGLVAAGVVDLADVRTFQALYLLDALSFLGYVGVLLAMPGVGRVALRRPDGPAGAAGGYREILADRVFLRVLACTLLLISFGYAQLEAGLTAFAIREGGVSPRVLAFTFAANTATIVAGQLLVLRRLPDRSRSRCLALVGVVWATAWCLVGLVGLAPGPVLAASLLLVAGSVYALGETVFAPVMPALVNQLAPDGLRGRYNAAHTLVWQVSMIIGPAVAGLLIGNGQATVWVLATVAGCLLGGGAGLSLRRRLTAGQDGRAEPVGADEPVPDLPPLVLAER